MKFEKPTIQKPKEVARKTKTEVPEAKVEDKEQILQEIKSWLDGVNSWAKVLAEKDMNTIKSEKEMMARQIYSHVNAIRESLDKLK